MKKISLIGAGAWGLSIANTIAYNDNKVTVYSNGKEVARDINQHHITRRLPGIKLSNKIVAEESMVDVVKNSDFIFIVTPSRVVKEVLKQIKECAISSEAIFIICSKGIDEEDLSLFSEIVSKNFPKNPFAVISGPNFAIEVAKKLPTITTISSNSKEVAQKVEKLMKSDFFLPIVSTNVINTQIYAIVKNILAIGCGIIDGLKLGENAKAAFLFKGVQEINNLAEGIGGNKDGFISPAGFGDLFLTCSSRDSRNNNLGFLIGKGGDMANILNEGNIVYEGVQSVKTIIKLAIKNNIEMPMCKMIHDILYQNTTDEDLELLIRKTIIS